MSNDVELTYKRVGEAYDGTIGSSGVEPSLLFEGWGFARMMTEVYKFLVATPEAGLLIKRTDREGLLPAQLEPQLLHLLRTDPVSYIKANTVPDRMLDLRGAQRTSKLAASEGHAVPKTTGLRHGFDTLADAFGEMVYTKARPSRPGQPQWLFEHPATGRWADLSTIEHWLGSHDTEVRPTGNSSGWLLIKVKLLLNTNAERFYYPREWNDFGSWITKEQLKMKLEQFRKDKAKCL